MEGREGREERKSGLNTGKEGEGNWDRRQGKKNSFSFSDVFHLIVYVTLPIPHMLAILLFPLSLNNTTIFPTFNLPNSTQ